MIQVRPRHARRDADSGGKLSQSTIIIIAVVCGCVVLLVFVLFLWRNIARRCRRSRKVPLPPVQDLAHHREQQLAAFAARPATWAAEPPMFHPHPRPYSSNVLSATASNASLIRSSPDLTSNGCGPTREGSWGGEDAPSTESSPYPTPLPTDDLRAPNPSYFSVGVNPHNSMASVVSDSSDALVTSSSELAPSVESSASLLPHARPRPGRVSRSRSRPLSVVSSAGTMHSVQSHSMNTLRGPAHSIHSNIQIVLPAPLAPELYPATRPSDDRISLAGVPRASSFYAVGGEGDRRTVADPWISGSQSRFSVRMDKRASGSSARLPSVGPRPASAPRPRSSLSKVASSSSIASDGASSKARRAQSQPPRAPTHPHPASLPPSPGPSRPSSAAFAPPGSPPPPVPRIPSVYGYGALEDPRRGRPQRKPAPLPLDAFAGALPPGAAPPVRDPLAQSGFVDRALPAAFAEQENGYGRESPRAQRQGSKLRKQRTSSQPDGGRRS
ncbi:hypothetical protein BD413DRAFT_562344 [Trametes elegans]|nr:hypothetical protein BD413DRAFT_562344 [Trametes elegans]